MKLLPGGVDLLDLSAREPSRPLRGNAEKTTLSDAIIQLAQARRGSDGAALSDIWTVVEAVFGGGAGDSNYLASDALSKLLEYLYPLSLLDWMGRCLEREGMRKDDGITYTAWALDQLGGENSARAFAVAQSGNDPLLFMRSTAFGEWAPKPGKHKRLEKEIDGIAQRCARVCRRAYLVRNFHVHRAQPYRATALGATLPLFAEMAREGLGHVVKSRFSEELPLTVAETEAVRVRQLAADFGVGRKHGAQPIREVFDRDLVRQPLRRTR